MYKKELTISGPILVPVGWLVAIIGAAGTSILVAFTVGIYVATQSTKAEAVAVKVDSLEKVYGDIHRMDTRLTRMETILAITFPAAKAEADRKLAGEK